MNTTNEEYRISPLKAWMVDALASQDRFKGSEFTKSPFRQAIINGPGNVAIIRDGRPMAAMGFVETLPGVGALWAAYSEQYEQTPKTLVKHTKALIESLVEDGTFHRLELMVDNNKPRLHAWARALGFKFEGVMKKRSIHKIDQAMYALTWDEKGEK